MDWKGLSEGCSAKILLFHVISGEVGSGDSFLVWKCATRALRRGFQVTYCLTKAESVSHE